jgi:hypothetical protein
MRRSTAASCRLCSESETKTVLSFKFIGSSSVAVAMDVYKNKAAKLNDGTPVDDLHPQA